MPKPNPFKTFRAAAGQGEILDRFGRVLAEGDMVIISGRGDLVWRVTKIRPIFTPEAPPGAQVITFAAAVESGVQQNMPVMEFLKVRDVSEYQAEGSLTAETPSKVVS